MSTLPVRERRARYCSVGPLAGARRMGRVSALLYLCACPESGNRSLAPGASRAVVALAREQEHCSRFFLERRKRWPTVRYRRRTGTTSIHPGRIRSCRPRRSLRTPRRKGRRPPKPRRLRALRKAKAMGDGSGPRMKSGAKAYIKEREKSPSGVGPTKAGGGGAHAAFSGPSSIGAKGLGGLGGRAPMDDRPTKAVATDTSMKTSAVRVGLTPRTRLRSRGDMWRLVAFLI